jgi:hypothetical protein
MTCAPPLTHKVCQGNSCVSVPGAGTDQCSSDAMCVAPPPPEPVTLSINFVFAFGGTQGSNQTAFFSGQLVPGTGSGGTGATSFSSPPVTQFIAPLPTGHIEFAQQGLMAGSWQVTAVVPNLTAPSTCPQSGGPPITVLPGQLRVITSRWREIGIAHTPQR